MTISEIIGLSLVIITLAGVIVALIFHIRSIRENRILQLVRYQNELLDKISNWVANVQNIYNEAYLIEDLISPEQTPSDSINRKLLLTTILRRKSAYGRVLEEGRHMLGIAVFSSKDLSEATKSLETCLQTSFETVLKYLKLVTDTSSDTEILDIIDKLDKEYMDNLKSIDESIVKMSGEILSS